MLQHCFHVRQLRDLAITRVLDLIRVAGATKRNRDKAFSDDFGLGVPRNVLDRRKLEFRK